MNVSFDGIANDGETGENDSVTGFENALGGDGNDTMTGDAGPNDLWGFDGNDTIDGRGGADDMGGLNGIDTITYATHTDPVTVTLDGGLADGAALRERHSFRRERDRRVWRRQPYGQQRRELDRRWAWRRHARRRPRRRRADRRRRYRHA